jgi:hypothetical protein
LFSCCCALDLKDVLALILSTHHPPYWIGCAKPLLFRKEMEVPPPPKATKATYTRLYNTKIGNTSKSTSVSMDSPKHSQSGEIRFGHSQSFDCAPSDADLELYRAGRKTGIPIRIVTYRKQGVPLPRTASGQSHRGQCRNASGGFYSA